MLRSTRNDEGPAFVALGLVNIFMERRFLNG
jgi:hypothetical protein